MNWNFFQKCFYISQEIGNGPGFREISFQQMADCVPNFFWKKPVERKKNPQNKDTVDNFKKNLYNLTATRFIVLHNNVSINHTAFFRYTIRRGDENEPFYKKNTISSHSWHHVLLSLGWKDILDWPLKSRSNTKTIRHVVNPTKNLFKLPAGYVLIPAFPSWTGSAYNNHNNQHYWYYSNAKKM